VWAELDEAEQGVVLAALLAGTEATLARIGRGAAERCRRAVATLQGADRQTREREIAQLTEQLLAPLPPGLRQVHPDWIEHRLSRQSPAVAAPLCAALDNAAPAHPAQRALIWRLCREVLGPLARSPATASFWGWSGERLQRALTALGCLVLAAHARRVQRPLRRQLLARLTPPFDAQVQRALTREALPGPPRALPAGWSTTEELLLLLGGDLLFSVLSSFEQRALALRLPRSLGLRLLEAPARQARDHDQDSDRRQVIAWLERADRWADQGAR
jgi:hypothetical protein